MATVHVPGTVLEKCLVLQNAQIGCKKIGGFETIFGSSLCKDSQVDATVIWCLSYLSYNLACLS